MSISAPQKITGAFITNATQKRIGQLQDLQIKYPPVWKTLSQKIFDNQELLDEKLTEGEKNIIEIYQLGRRRFHQEKLYRIMDPIVTALVRQWKPYKTWIDAQEELDGNSIVEPEISHNDLLEIIPLEESKWLCSKQLSKDIEESLDSVFCFKKNNPQEFYKLCKIIQIAFQYFKEPTQVECQIRNYCMKPLQRWNIIDEERRVHPVALAVFRTWGTHYWPMNAEAFNKLYDHFSLVFSNQYDNSEKTKVYDVGKIPKEMKSWLRRFKQVKRDHVRQLLKNQRKKRVKVSNEELDEKLVQTFFVRN